MEPVVQEPTKHPLFRKVGFWYAVATIVVVGVSVTFFILSKVYTNYSYTSTPQVAVPAHTDTPSVATKPGWEGDWTMVDSTEKENATIVISKLTGHGFNFHVNAWYGANDGDWSNYNDDPSMGKVGTTGTLVLKNNVATYKDDPRVSNPFTNKPCTGTFTLSKDGMSLDLKTDCNLPYSGLNVTFDGTYRKDAVIAPTDLSTLKAFKDNPGSYGTFTSLVGNDAESFEGSDDVENVDHDNDFNATVSTLWVHGLPDMGSIIMVAPGNKVWAATIYFDDKPDVDPVIHYYSNVPAWKNTLPDTIANWPTSDSEYKVIYENRQSFWNRLISIF